MEIVRCRSLFRSRTTHHNYDVAINLKFSGQKVGRSLRKRTLGLVMVMVVRAIASYGSRSKGDDGMMKSTL
eukprot:scaffold14698_cov196-Amphora_coffeaeformis.AAC.10